MKKNVLLIASILLAGSFVFTSCKKNDENNVKQDYSNATFVVCEGNYGSNDGEIFAIVDSKSESDIFSKANNRPIGDVVQSMTIIDDKAYIVVNNSGKIEVVDKNSFKSIGHSSGFSYPQCVIERNENEIFVSNGKGYGDDYIYTVDKISLQKIDSIATGLGPKSMILTNNKLFVANYGGYSTDKTITIIDNTSLKAEKTIEIGDMPSDMLLDENGDIIIVCKGATEYDAQWNPIGSTNSKIVKLNPTTFEVSEILNFDHQLASFGSNLIAYNNGTLYYIDDAVYAYTNGNAQKLIDGYFYSIDVDSKTGDIWTTSTPATGLHYVSQYDNKGKFINKYTVGNFPNSVIF